MAITIQMRVIRAGMILDKSGATPTSYSEAALVGDNPATEKVATLTLRQTGTALATAMVPKINQTVPVTIG